MGEPASAATDPLLWHRLQFAFTIVYHYLFPQLTMGLALLIVVMKGLGLRAAARAGTTRRALDPDLRPHFAVGVVTGIPMEFQFGHQRAALHLLRRRRHRQTLAMEA